MTVSFPAVAAATGGALLVLQMLLALAVSGARGRASVWIGTGVDSGLERTGRRHANFAENAGLFLAGFTLLELSGRWPTLLLVLCASLVVLRLFHAAGLSREDTNNPLRLIGGAGNLPPRPYPGRGAGLTGRDGADGPPWLSTTRTVGRRR